MVKQQNKRSDNLLLTTSFVVVSVAADTTPFTVFIVAANLTT